MQRIAVKPAGSQYDVIVERGALDNAAEYVRTVIGERRLFVAADPGAWRAQGARLEAGLRSLDYTVLSMEGGEENKRIRQVEALAEKMYAAGADRKCCVIAFGGGIAGDVGGFLAASYMRGVDVIQIPTTLLAQVDAAIGGKTGVNLASGKNLVGAFHQPRLVLVDPSTLATLPEREYRAGLYEVVKAGIIWSRELFDVMALMRDNVLARKPEVLESIIAESVRIKAEVVSKDEREGDLRRILNYGHTLGHTLEAETNYKLLLHGEAVAFGMIAAGWLAEGAGVLAHGDRETMEQAIRAYGPIPNLDGISAARLVERIGGDKKTIGGKVHFVLADRIGHVKVMSGLNPSLIEQAAATALKLCSETASRAAERQSVAPR